MDYLNGELLILILLETPVLTFFAHYKTFIIKDFNLQTDIVEGFESEMILDDGGVCRQAFDRITLNEQTVAFILEVAIDLSFAKISISERDIAEQCHGSGETQVVRVRSSHPPLSQQITSLVPLLTGEEQQHGEQ
jgi:hypothetical protein